MPTTTRKKNPPPPDPLLLLCRSSPQPDAPTPPHSAHALLIDFMVCSSVPRERHCSRPNAREIVRFADSARPENRGRDVEWRVAMRPGRRRQLGADGEKARLEREKASIRAKTEQPFLYMKRMFGYGKVRCRARQLPGPAQERAADRAAAGLRQTADRRVAPGGVIAAPGRRRKRRSNGRRDMKTAINADERGHRLQIALCQTFCSGRHGFLVEPAFSDAEAHTSAGKPSQ